jgi:hypothetical protein
VYSTLASINNLVTLLVEFLSPSPMTPTHIHCAALLLLLLLLLPTLLIHVLHPCWKTCSITTNGKRPELTLHEHTSRYEAAPERGSLTCTPLEGFSLAPEIVWMLPVCAACRCAEECLP